MVRSKILFLEQELNRKPIRNKELLEAVNNLKVLLKQIDFTAEVVPVENRKRVLSLFTSLKDEPLTKKEHLVITRLLKV